MKFADFTERVARVPRQPVYRVDRVIKALFIAMREDILNGEKVMVPKFGVFKRHTRKSRFVKHPITSEPLLLPSVCAVGFRASMHSRRPVDETRTAAPTERE